MHKLLELSRAIEARDAYTRGHSARVSSLAEAVASRLGWEGDRLATLRLGGALHDVGKLAVPLAVLRKRGRLNDAELAEVRAHPAAGASLVEPIPALRPALPCVLYHHERWDGAGYPTGRSGREIPLEARILAVADAFDAMTSDRPYRCALPTEQALEELDRCAGSQFDPDVAQVFVDGWRHGTIRAPVEGLRAAAS